MEFDIWKKYSRLNIIYKQNYITLFKVQNKINKIISVIKQYDKEKYKNFHSIELNEENIKNSIDNTLIIDFVSHFSFFYIIIKNIDFKLEDYLTITEKYFSYEEIKQILLAINKNLKFIKNNNIDYTLDISNIIFPLDKINQQTVKLIGPKLTTNEMSFLKNKIHYLGEIIYFMLNHHFPSYDNKILFQIKINSIQNLSLKNLISQMLTNNISWRDYFNNSFFKDNINIKKTIFNIKCNNHSEVFYYYCPVCKENLCDLCLLKHSTHKIIPFSEIGLNDFEINEMEVLFKEINQNLENIIKLKDNIQNILNKIKEIKSNKYIYENDEINNYKTYYFNQLKYIKEKIKIDNIINLIDFSINKKNEKNLILSVYDIPKKKILSLVKILNIEKNKIKDIYLNNTKIPFIKEYLFEKEGQYNIKIICNPNFNNLSNIFSSCKYITSLDLSNLNINSISNMKNMLINCDSLSTLNLSNLNTNNVIDMSGAFFGCSSLIYLDLSNFNTFNVSDMSYMFSFCCSLTYLDLSNFNTNKVIDMSYMFYQCKSLIILNLYNFNTNNVNNMNYMFYFCSSLNSLNLSNLNTSNVKYMCSIFAYCSSLNSLNLSNFNINNVIDMSYMFFNCSSLIDLNLSEFNVNNIADIHEIFSGMNKNCNIITKDHKILNNFNEYTKK